MYACAPYTWCWVRVIEMVLSFTKCTSMKCGFLFLKKHVKFGRAIKIASSKVCPITRYTFSPFFGQFVNRTPAKIFPIHRPIFSYLCMNQRDTHRVRDPSMQTSGNRKRQSLASKPYGVELPSRVLSTCRELVLPYVTVHCHEEK